MREIVLQRDYKLKIRNTSSKPTESVKGEGVTKGTTGRFHDEEIADE
jgi:hypothetical protein